MRHGVRFIDRTGQRFGHLLVIEFAGKNSLNQSNWLCQCDCGNQKIVFSGNLKSGHTISCGCKKGLAKHGENRNGERTAEYQTLAGIIERCTNPNNSHYHQYGGRGIKVCSEWDGMEKIRAFVEHVGRRPSPKHTIERINNNGNYEPGNVRWATSREQSRNKRSNVLITFRGETLCRADMAAKYGISAMGLKKRLAKGMSVEAALTIPVDTKMWNGRNLRAAA